MSFYRNSTTWMFVKRPSLLLCREKEDDLERRFELLTRELRSIINIEGRLSNLLLYDKISDDSR